MCRAERAAGIDAQRAHPATSQMRWPAGWMARAYRLSVRLHATRLRHEPLLAASAKRIAIDSTG